ncbi:MAG: protein kinase [Chloroflexi bacterium]|nr:protein kinase [Chloroflexota bacterium]
MINSVINDRYRLDAILGQGGMGTVYRAHDTALKRDVAIKLMSETKLGNDGRARLMHEAQAIAKLSHPNIIIVHDVGEYESDPFIVMELIDGPNLNDYKPDGFEEIVSITRQMCAALQHAHNNEIIHRDLKPENIMLDPNKSVKLMDFGLARSVASRLTTEGTIVGTVFYLPPEIAMGQKIDGRADLYSLGVMLYELTTGQPPFTDEDPVAIISQHLHAPVVPPRAKNASIPPKLNELIVQLLSKDPDDRPASGDEIQKILDDPKILDINAAPDEELSVLGRIVRGRMVGRRKEFDEARSLWNKTVNGQGQTLLISGEPGIGKTRLMRDIVTHADVSGGHAFVGESYAEGSAPYDAFAQIIRKSLKRNVDNGLHIPDFVLADLLTMAPEIELQYPDIKPNPSLEPEAQQRRLFENMVAFCEVLSEKAPLLLVVDDAHWSDSGTLFMLRHLMRRTRKQNVMIVATYREVELDEALPFNEVLLDLNRERLGTRLKLTRLNRNQTQELLSAIFSTEITPQFLDGIYKETEGNPFFVEEVCKALVESGKVYYENGEWQRPDTEEIEIPQGVKVAIQSRVSKLPETCKSVMTAAAVIGREFDFETLVKVTEVNEDELITALEDGLKAQLIEELKGKGGENFSFAHALIPAALRENLGGLRRGRLHRRVAAAVEDLHPEDYEVLAYHYGEAGDEERGLEFTIKAAQRAKDTFANEAAVRYYSEALDVVVEDAQRFELLAGRAQVYSTLAKRELQGTDLETMMKLADKLDDDGLRVDTLVAQADFFMRADNLTEQLPAAERAVEIAEKLDDPSRLAQSYNELSRAHRLNGEYIKSQGYLEKALDLLKELQETNQVIETLGWLSGLYAASNHPKEAKKLAEEALALSQETGDLEGESNALNQLSFVHYINKEYPKYQDTLEKSLNIVRQIGLKQYEFYILTNLAYVECILGNQEKNLQLLEEALEFVWVNEEPSAVMLCVYPLSFYKYFRPGNIEAGLKFLSTQLNLAGETNDPRMVAMVKLAEGIFQTFSGQVEAGLNTIESIRDQIVEFMGTYYEWTFAFIAGWCYMELGDFDQARISMEKLFTARLEKIQDSGQIGDMLRMLARLTYLEGNPKKFQAGLKQAQEAVQSYELIGVTGLIGRDAYTLALDTAANLHLVLDQSEQALENSQKMVELEEKEILVFKAPYYLTHSRVLRANGQDDEADDYLRRAHTRVMQVADNTKDLKIRKGWLENLRSNREGIEEFEGRGLG